MRQNAEFVISRGLVHEGGYVNHPRDPGGPTNMGITLGTLKRLGYDIDGDGDVDIMDVKHLKKHHAIDIYKRFYWDPVQGDLLPSGLDLTAYDYGINSGPGHPAKAIQRLVGSKIDGQIGPRTLTAVKNYVEKHGVNHLINAVNDERLRFMKRAKDKQGRRLWLTFGGGWAKRVKQVRANSIKLAGTPRKPINPLLNKAKPGELIPVKRPESFWVRFFRRIFS